jgi:hypothetical protein
MRKYDPEDIITLLMYLDIEYLDDASCDALSSLDINNPSDQMEIIRLAMHDEIMRLNEISRVSMKKILDEMESYPEAEVRRMIIERVGMPFQEPLQDYKAFFKRVYDYFFANPGD